MLNILCECRIPERDSLCNKGDACIARGLPVIIHSFIYMYTCI